MPSIVDIVARQALTTAPDVSARIDAVECALIARQARTPGPDAAAWPDMHWIPAPSTGPITITGDLAVTLADMTMSAAAILEHFVTGTSTLDDMTMSAAGTVTTPGGGGGGTTIRGVPRPHRGQRGAWRPQGRRGR